MTDITVIILVGNEERHIERCLEKLLPLEPRQIMVIESQTGDRTHELIEKFIAQSSEPKFSASIASESPAASPCIQTCFHAWPGTQAEQLNWALEQLEIQGEWVLRLDADEYLTPATIKRIKQIDWKEMTGVEGFALELKRKFLGGELKRWRSNIWLVRLFRKGRGCIENRAMDEHVVVDGRVEKLSGGAFYDDNLNDLDWWKAKHCGYAQREAADFFARFSKYWPWTKCDDTGKRFSFKDRLKITYYKLPAWIRPTIFFLRRYVLEGACLDGRVGWRWCYWQTFWYRSLVEKEISKLSRQRKG